MSDLQHPQPAISEETCKELARETIILLGDASSAISAPLSLAINYIVAVLTAVLFTITMYSLLIVRNFELLLRNALLIGLTLLNSLIALIIIRHFMLHRGLRHVETIRNTLLNIVFNRKSLLQDCQNSYCKDSLKPFCPDIDIAVKAVELLRELSKNVKYTEKGALKTIFVIIRRQ